MQDCRGSAVRRGDAPADAVGCHLLSVALQHGVHHGGVLVDENLLTLLLSAPIHGICLLLCARDARFFDLVLLWSGRDCRRYSRICACGRQAAIRLWRSTCRITATRNGAARSSRVHAGRERIMPTANAARVAARAHGCGAHSLRRARGFRGHSYGIRRLSAGVSSRAARASRAATTPSSTIGTSGSTCCGGISRVPNVALWTHVIRRRARRGASASTRAGSARRRECHFAGRARSRAIGTGCARRRSCSMSCTSRSCIGRLPARRPGLLSRLLAKTQRTSARAELADALDACEKLSQTLAASLARYEPEMLGCYRHGSIWCSSLLEYLGLLINGERQRMPLPAWTAQPAFWRARACSSAPKPSNIGRRTRPGWAPCSASRNIRRPPWSACSTGCCPRRCRSCSPSPSPS